jgi:hypothetical protein
MSGGWERPPAAIHGLGLTRNDGTSKAQAVTTRSGGASTTARTNNSGRCGIARSKDDRHEFPNDHVLRRLIREAEFVLECDPYRGMLLDVRKQHPGSAASLIDNPWKTCRYATVDPPNKEHNQDAILNDKDKLPTGGLSDHLLAKIWVEETAQFSCPSLVEWTEAAITKERQASKKKGNKKRKQVEEEEEEQPTTKAALVGQRPEGANARCRCDYNPYCIVS